MADRSWQNQAPSRDGWFQIGTFDVTTSALIPMIGAVSMLVYAIDKVLLAHLSFEPNLVAKAQIWRLVTWPIPNPPDIFVALALYLFYLFGTQLEQFLGRIQFLKYVMFCVIVPSVLMTALYLVVKVAGADTSFLLGTSIVGGIRTLEVALLAAVAVEFPTMRFLFGIPARIIAAVFIAIDILQLLGDQLWGAVIFELVVVAVALIALRSFGMGSNLPSWVPVIQIPGLGNGQQTGRSGASVRVKSTAKAKRPSRSKEGSVVTGPWGETGTGTAGPSASGSSTRTGLNRNDREEVDRLLDKIAASGMESLSNDDRTRLEEASKRLREGGQ